MPSISNARRFIEVCAVIITGAGKFILVDLLPYKFWFIAIAIVFWSGYISFWAIKDPQILSYWGFQKQNFKKLLVKILPLALLVVLFFVIYGTLNDSLVISWHIFPVILLYPIWGTLQQFLMIGLVAINLHDNTLIAAPRILIVLLTSILFSVVHYPSIQLIVGTFFLAIFYTLIFLRYRNLWVLGLYHGWLGAFFYFFVLGRDPWLEVFGTL